MKILHIINAYSPVFGCGPADRCQKMSNYLASKGHEVSIFTTNHSWDEEYAKNTKNVEIKSFPYMFGRFCYSPLMKDEINKRINEFDVVHLMNHWTYQNILAYKACIKANKPFIFSAMGALPIVYRSFVIKKIYNNLYGYNILKEASALIAITKMECGQYEDQNVEKSKIYYIPNAIDANEYFKEEVRGNFRNKLSISDNKKIILFLGRLDHIKGCDILLDGFIQKHHELKDCIVVFAGPDYGMKDLLTSKVNQNNLQNKVIICGALTGQDKLNAYTDADLFVVPSRQENMSIVAVEAAAKKTPVVITDTCDFNEIQEFNAGIVTKVDSLEIIDSIIKIIKDPDLHSKMSENAYSMVKDYYTWDSVGKKYEEVLKKVLSVEC